MGKFLTTDGTDRKGEMEGECSAAPGAAVSGGAIHGCGRLLTTDGTDGHGGEESGAGRRGGVRGTRLGTWARHWDSRRGGAIDPGRFCGGGRLAGIPGGECFNVERW